MDDGGGGGESFPERGRESESLASERMRFKRFMESSKSASSHESGAPRSSAEPSMVEKWKEKKGIGGGLGNGR